MSLPAVTPREACAEALGEALRQFIEHHPRQLSLKDLIETVISFACVECGRAMHTMKLTPEERTEFVRELSTLFEQRLNEITSALS